MLFMENGNVQRRKKNTKKSFSNVKREKNSLYLGDETDLTKSNV